MLHLLLLAGNRTMQTAVGVSGRGGYDSSNGRKHGDSQQWSSSNNKFKWPIIRGSGTLLRTSGVHWCETGRSISEYKPLFPAFDYPPQVYSPCSVSFSCKGQK